MDLKTFANPQAIIEHIENSSTGESPTDPYRARIEELMGLFLHQHGDVDEVEDAEHMRAMSAGLVLETAARQTGFIIGFEYCRDLIVGGGSESRAKPSAAKRGAK